MPSLLNEQPFYDDTDGLPIVNGSIYIGTQNTDPIANPITIYSDRDLTVSIANPQPTNSYGRSTNAIWVPGKYSIQVNDSAGVQKYQKLDSGDVTQTGISVLTNVQGTNTITAEGSPAIATLVDQQQYNFTTVAGNTGAVTLQIDLTAAKSILKEHDVTLVSGDLEANQIVSVVYNGTDDVFELISNVANIPYVAGVLGTPIATTSGTAHDFGNIPNTAIKIIFMLDSVSTDGTSGLLIQIGDAGGIETTGYVSTAQAAAGNLASTAGFVLQDTALAAGAASGVFTIYLTDPPTRKWVGAGILDANDGASGVHYSAGVKSLVSGILTDVRLTTVSGDTFDGGSFNIMYE